MKDFTEVQIEQAGVSVPGCGGLNYDGLMTFGWKPGMWVPVVDKTPNGVVVKFPNASGRFFIKNHEISDRR